MGLGGQKQESNAPTGAGLTEGKTSRLAHMADAELRKWAKAYGVVDPDKSERATLLQEMVSCVDSGVVIVMSRVLTPLTKY